MKKKKNKYIVIINLIMSSEISAINEHVSFVHVLRVKLVINKSSY